MVKSTSNYCHYFLSMPFDNAGTLPVQNNENEANPLDSEGEEI